MQQVVFHSFRLGDVDDPEIYAAMPIHKWQETEQGQWVMEHCADPVYNLEPSYLGHQVTISGNLKDPDATFFALKWGSSAKT